MDRKDELADVLTQIADRLARLLDLLQAEQTAVLQARADALQDIATQKESLIDDLRVLESRRVAAMHDTADLLGLPRQDLCLKSVAEAMEPPPAERLLAIRRRLRRLSGRIQEANRINMLLLRDSLGFVHNALNTLGQLVNPQSVYRQDGQIRGGTSGGQVIQGQI